MICVDGEQKCVDDLGREGAIFAKCQEAMLAGRLPELKRLMEKDGRLRMERILEVQVVFAPFERVRGAKGAGYY